ncbi:MAG: GNAT family N-acetyltransferase [Gemmataceae bacterium]|nr:GNAT family N-acetyltransferase [Gemmataceae bacterium]
MTAVRQVLAGEDTLLRPLAELLTDAVDGGASVGFLAPLARADAEAYWRGVFAALGDGVCLWVAEADGRVVGSAQLAPCVKPNGRHRAEVQKLFVLGAFRGRGIATDLMRAVERHAAALGRTLLVLDTQAGSAAETLYRKLGWQKAGEIPDYAASPNGELQATAYYFKAIGR